MEDHELLREYSERRTEAAFAELVSRHINLVYSTALRMVGEPQFAQDVAQTVFIELAGNPKSIREPRALVGWLYRTTRFTAASALRTEQRRRQRENVAMEMNQAESNSETAWQHLAPHIDEAMAALDIKDQNAVVLRFFENKSFREVGAALGMSDDAAQKRVSRAVERLRECLAKQGFTFGATGLIALISANAVDAAPNGLAASISGAALASIRATGEVTFLKLMAITKLKLTVVGTVVVMGVIVVLLLRRESSSPTGQKNPSASRAATNGTDLTADSRTFKRGNVSPHTAPAEEIVAGKVIQFGRKRHEIVNAIARRLNVSVPYEIEAFFDALEAGNWEETKKWRDFLATHTYQYDYSKGDRPDLFPFWQAVLDAYLPAEAAHKWPAQKFLDYGNAILDSLRPGMVYLGGTDPGRAIPTLLNETSANPRIVLTQNALANGAYLDYLRDVYGGRFNTLSDEDQKRAFEEYMADARKRLEHDQQFPDEPKQIRPGENIRMVDGKEQVAGQTAVMAVNEKLLKILMERNPDLSFAMEDSYPLPGMYANAVPLGAVIELNAPDAQKIFTAERAAESVDYWRNFTQQLIAAPETPDDSEVRKTYSKMIATQASLFVDRHYDVEAEQAFRLATEICPYSSPAVSRYVQLLTSQKRFGDAVNVLESALRTGPENKELSNLLEQVKQLK